MYYNQEKEKLGEDFLEYLINLQTAFIAKLKKQLESDIETNTQTLANVKFERADFINFIDNDFKLHNLFAPEGMHISGKIAINVQADVPGHNGNMRKQYSLEVNFNPTHIVYNFDNENFDIKEDINISYISNS